MSASMVLFGRELINRIEQRNRGEAQLRYEMGRVRENAESIAMVGGADDEVKSLRATMQLVTAAWSRVVSSQAWLTWLMGGNGVMAPVLPLLLQRRAEPRPTFGKSGAGKPHAGIRGGGTEQSAPLPDRFAAGLWLATRDAPGLAEGTGENDNAGNAQLHSDRERSHSGCDGSTRGVCGAGDRGRGAGAVVRVSSGMDDAAQLTAVLRAVRASASRS